MKPSYGRKPWWATLVLVVAAMSAGCGIREQPAKERVTAVLQALSESGGDSKHASAQTAVCQWAKGVMIIMDTSDLSLASNNFTVWAKEKDIFRKISSFQVTGAQAVDPSPYNEVIVSVEIEGRPLKIRVIPNAPLQWAD